MKRFIYRLLGIACRNAPYGCATTVVGSDYCKWCWNRGLYSKMHYEDWTRADTISQSEWLKRAMALEK